MRLRRWDFAVPMDAKGREVMAISSAFADDRARNLFPASTARRNQLCLAAEVIARAPLRVGTQQESSASWRLWGTPSPNAELLLVAFRTRPTAMKNSAGGGDTDPVPLPVGNAKNWKCADVRDNGGALPPNRKRSVQALPA